MSMIKREKIRLSKPELFFSVFTSKARIALKNCINESEKNCKQKYSNKKNANHSPLWAFWYSLLRRKKLTLPNQSQNKLESTCNQGKTIFLKLKHVIIWEVFWKRFTQMFILFFFNVCVNLFVDITSKPYLCESVCRGSEPNQRTQFWRTLITPLRTNKGNQGYIEVTNGLKWSRLVRCSSTLTCSSECFTLTISHHCFASVSWSCSWLV